MRITAFHVLAARETKRKMSKINKNIRPFLLRCTGNLKHNAHEDHGISYACCTGNTEKMSKISGHLIPAARETKSKMRMRITAFHVFAARETKREMDSAREKRPNGHEK